MNTAVQIASVGNKRGWEIYLKMKEEYGKTLKGTSEMGKFGVYADEFLSAKEIGMIREATREAVAAMKKTCSGLLGSLPDGYRTSLAGGKEIRYAKFLGIK